MKLCECGKCNKEVKSGNRFIRGHNTSRDKPAIELICEGCGIKVIKWPCDVKKRTFCSRKCANRNPSIENLQKRSKTNKINFLKKKSNTTTWFSKQEQRLAPIMKKLGYTWGSEKRLAIKCNDRIRVPDFYNPNTKEIIEVFGYWWHRDYPGKVHEAPEYVIEQYALVGWKCIVM